MHKDYCCQCGRRRRPFEAQCTGYTADPGIIHILAYRLKHEMPDEIRKVGFGNETYPQLLARASIYRNGGTDENSTHICPECIAVGLRKLIAIMQEQLDAIEEHYGKPEMQKMPKPE